MILRNQSGFSLTEMLVAAAITGLISLGGMQLMKGLGDNKKSFDNRMGALEASKLIEQALNGPKGCDNVINKEVGTEIGVKLGGSVIQKGQRFGSLNVDNLRIERYLPTDESGLTGMAEISLVMSSSRNSPPSRNKFLLAVNVRTTPEKKTLIESCNAGRQKSINGLVDKLCQGTYGANTPDLSCSQVIQFLQKITARSICKDIYGDSAKMKMNGQYCDLSEVHKNKKCPPGKILAGFDTRGELICRDIPSPDASNLCRKWTNFIPDEKTECPNVDVFQTRNCQLPEGLQASESRTVKGTKVSGCDLSNRCRPPGSWMNKEGHKCIAEDPNETYEMFGQEPSTTSGQFGPYVEEDKTYVNTGSVNFICVNGEAQILTSTCTKSPVGATGN